MSSASRTTLASASCAVPPPDEHQLRRARGCRRRATRSGIAGQDRHAAARASRSSARRAARASTSALELLAHAIDRQRRADVEPERAQRDPAASAAARRLAEAIEVAPSRSDRPLTLARGRGRRHTRSRSPRSAASDAAVARRRRARSASTTQPRLPRMQREAQHPPPERRDRVAPRRARRAAASSASARPRARPAAAPRTTRSRRIAHARRRAAQSSGLGEIEPRAISGASCSGRVS